MVSEADASSDAAGTGWLEANAGAISSKRDGLDTREGGRDIDPNQQEDAHRTHKCGA